MIVTCSFSATCGVSSSWQNVIMQNVLAQQINTSKYSEYCDIESRPKAYKLVVCSGGIGLGSQ